MRSRVLAVLALLLALPLSVAADHRLVIAAFGESVTVDKSGSIQVEERLVPRFTGTWNGIYRTIPIQYKTPQGLNYTLRLELQSVTDDTGTPLRYETSHERQYLKIKIWVPGASDAERRVKIRYRVANALRFFEDHDELYWNVTGDEWDVPIETTTATIQLPAGVTGVRATAFRGAQGATQQNEVSVSDNTVSIGTGLLGMHEGLTAVVGWDPGVVHRPTRLERLGSVIYSNLPLTIPLFVFAGMFSLWRSKGRDPAQAPIVTQYEPPKGITPSELGTLVDASPDMRDISAAIVDLAVRGYLHIDEIKAEHLGGLFSNTDYRFTLKKDRSEWDPLKAHERDLLNALFAGSDTVLLSDLKNKFYKSLPGIKNDLYNGLVDGGFYTARPDRVRATYIIIAFVIAWSLAFFGGKIVQDMGMQALPTLLAGVFSGIIVFAFGWFMPCRTAAGARELEQILGFQEFLTRVDADRLQRTIKTPEMFERFLPYAMALGVESHWAKQFEGIAIQPPQWYTGYGPTPGFNTLLFTNNLSRMSTAASHTMASAPRSSGGSGFSGGSSGGGFGGGGGGGF